MRSCNYCGRGALGDEPNCRECGKSLTEAASKPPPLEWIPVEREESQQTQQLTTRRKLGWLLILGSLAILGGTYVFARNSPGGGYFIVPTGALALGLYFLQRPALMSSDGKLSMTLGDLMAKAGALEGVDRDRALQVYEEIARRYPGTPEGQEAARNIAVLLRRRHPPTH